MPLRICVASLKPAKIDAVREAVSAIATFDRRFAGVEWRAVDVSDVAPRMPMSEAEIIDGARRRVAAVLERRAHPGAAYVVGLEGGVDRIAGDRLALKSWACVSDGATCSLGGGGAIVLPPAIAADVTAGAELGDAIETIAGDDIRGTRGAWGLLTHDLVTRRDAFRTAVISAFAPFYNAALYERP